MNYLALSELLLNHRIGLTVERYRNPDPDPSATAGRVIKILDLDTQALTPNWEQAETAFLQDTETSRRHQLRSGDVLVSLRFIKFWSGWIASELPHPLYASKNMAVLTPNQDKILPPYLTLWFRNEAAQSQIAARSTRVTHAGNKLGRNFSALNLSDLLKISVPVPDLTAQAAIVAEYEAILEQEADWQQQIQSRKHQLQQRFR